MNPMKRMLTCEQTIRVLSDYLDGNLPRSQRCFIKLHLLMCPTCRAFLRSLDHARAMAKVATAEEVPEEVSQMVEALMARFRSGS